MEQGSQTAQWKGLPWGQKRGWESSEKTHEYRRRHYRRVQDLSDPGDDRTPGRMGLASLWEPHKYPLVSCPLSPQDTRAVVNWWSPRWKGTLRVTDMVKEKRAGFHPAGSWELPVLTGELAGLGGLPQREGK